MSDVGDLTASLVARSPRNIRAHIVPRANGVIAGLEILPTIVAVFAEHYLPLPPPSAHHCDGDVVQSGTRVATLEGPSDAIVAIERTALNFLGRMSGVATRTRSFVDLARQGNPAVAVLDTRKTIPGWRALDKLAVRCGGGTNHRSGLHDAVLIKDNHLAGIASDELTRWLEERLSARRIAELGVVPAFIEVEVDTLEQFDAVARVEAVDIVLLDNFSTPEHREAVKRRNLLNRQRPLALEASGNVTLDTIESIAATGVDRISVGAITHSAPNFDIGLDFESDGASPAERSS